MIKNIMQIMSVLNNIGLSKEDAKNLMYKFVDESDKLVSSEDIKAFFEHNLSIDNYISIINYIS
jgi:hypothetical protein